MSCLLKQVVKHTSFNSVGANSIHAQRAAMGNALSPMIHLALCTMSQLLCLHKDDWKVMSKTGTDSVQGAHSTHHVNK